MQCWSFFLNSARIGHDKTAFCLQIVEIDHVKRINQMNVFYVIKDLMGSFLDFGTQMNRVNDLHVISFQNDFPDCFKRFLHFAALIFAAMHRQKNHFFPGIQVIENFMPIVIFDGFVHGIDCSISRYVNLI